MFNNTWANVKTHKTALWLTLYGLYFAILKIVIVPFGDDQFWWGPAGRFLLRHHFYTLSDQQYIGGSSNGRYLSNLTMIFSSHHPIVSYLIFGAFIVLLVYLLARLVGKSKLILFLSLLLPFTLSRPFLTTTWLWYAAFVNYVCGMVFIFAYLLILKNDYFDQSKFNKYLPIISIFLSLCGGLIVEHLTIYQLIVSLFAIGFFRLKKHRYRLHQLTYLLGAVISATIMFSNGSYWVHTSYRNISLSTTASWQIFAQTSHFWLISLNLILILLLTGSIFFCNYQRTRQTFKTTLVMSLSVVFAIYYCLSNLYLRNHFSLNTFAPDISKFLQGYDSLIGIFFVIYLIVSTVWLEVDATTKFSLWFCLVSCVILTGPFLIITSPNSAREFFGGVLFMYLFAFLLIRQLHFTRPNLRRFRTVMASLLSLGCLALLVANVQNYHCFLEHSSRDVVPGAIAEVNQVPHPSLMPNGDLYTTSDGVRYWQAYHRSDFSQRLFKLDYPKNND